jgi:hypothetical protein
MRNERENRPADRSAQARAIIVIMSERREASKKEQRETVVM